jgi:hypothetical protein
VLLSAKAVTETENIRRSERINAITVFFFISTSFPRRECGKPPSLR